MYMYVNGVNISYLLLILFVLALCEFINRKLCKYAVLLVLTKCEDMYIKMTGNYFLEFSIMFS